MREIDYLIDILYSEKYLLDVCSNIIGSVESDNFHDFLLGIFDEVDEIIRNVNKCIINNGESCEYDMSMLISEFNDKLNAIEY